MAPLSKDLAGLILDHDLFGSHLDDNGKTLDPDLERENFAHAGNILAEIWSNTIIDGHKTIASYVKPEDSEKSEIDTLVTAEWRSRHVRESHYFFQVG